MKHRYLKPILFALLFSATPVLAQDASWFEDVTTQVGFNDVPAWRLYVTDVNNDDYPDLCIINGIYNRNQLSLWLNVPDPEGSSPAERMFVDITEESGINAHQNSEIDGRIADVGALADIDNDGDVDLVTGRFYYRYEDYTMPEDQSAVMLNDGNGHFTHVVPNGITEVEQLNSTAIAYFDYNLDGNLDVYAGTFSWNHALSLYMADNLFRGRGDGTFENVTKESNIGSVEQPLYGVNIADWNNDGWPDVLTGPYCRTSGSLWMNNGDGTFSDVASQVGYSSQKTGGDHGQPLCQWEGMPADFDNDGDMDVLQVLVHGGYGPGEGRTVIAVNGGPENDYSLTWDHGRINRDAPVTAHIGDMSGSWIDFDNDGWLDLVIDQSQYPQANEPGVERSYFLLQNPSSNAFNDVTEELGLDTSLLAPGASEVLDYDLDGDDDLLIVVNTNKNQNNSIRLLENRVGTENNWIGIKLDAPEGVNRDAIGARVKVTAGGITRMKEITAGNGHFGGQQPLIRNFGIGDNPSIERIEVRWPHPSMQNTVVTDPPINRIVTIGKEGIASVREESTASLRLDVSPIPADHSVNVTVPASVAHDATTGSRVQHLSFRVVNVVGQPVVNGTIQETASTFSINTSALPAGYYTLALMNGGVRVAERSFLVTHR
jgi:hypothetical protein